MKQILSKSFFLVFFLCLMVRFFLLQAQAIEAKTYDGLVNDFAQVLSEETETQLEDKLIQEARREDGSELAVVTINSLEGESIEQVALAYFDEWKIGKRGLDNGVLMLLTIEDREIRIQTGYGAEGVLPDGLTGRIIRQDIVPHLQNNDYDQAVIAGVDRVLSYLSNPELAREQLADSSELSLWILFLILFLMVSGVAFFIWLIAKHAPSLPSSGTRSSSHRSIFSNSSSSSSSSSSFSFGGGRSGGGGASGKW